MSAPTLVVIACAAVAPIAESVATPIDPARTFLDPAFPDPLWDGTSSAGGPPARLSPEFCTLVVRGAAAAGDVNDPERPWHEAVLGWEAQLPQSAAWAAGAEASGPTVLRIEARGRDLLLAGRPAEAWELLRELDPDPDGEAAYLRAWAAARSGLREADTLLAPFTRADVPLTCRAPARRLAARAAAQRGDLSRALAMLRSLGADLPAIPDYIELWQLEAQAAAGDLAGAEAAYQALRASGIGAGVARAAERALVAALTRAGRIDRARSLLTSLAARVPRAERPEVLLGLAELETREKDLEAAGSQLRRLATLHPASAEAGKLLEPGFVARWPGFGLSAEERATLLFAQGRGEEAVRGLTPTSDPRLLRLRGDMNLRRDAYGAAAADYRELIERGAGTDEVRLELAKAYARAGEPARGRAIYQELHARSPAGGRAATLIYLTADAFQEEAVAAPDRADSAAAWFRLLVDRHPRAELASRGLLRLAHLRFARGDFAAAEALYREHLRRYPGDEDAREARYWLARALEKGGRRAEARPILTGLMDRGWRDYYAQLARRRLGGSAEAALGAFFGTGRKGATIRKLGSEAADSALTLPGAAGTALVRARQLLVVGEDVPAQREIDDAVRLSGRSRADLERVGRWALAYGYPESAFRIGAALSSGGAEASVARLAFPRAFAAQVLAEARETGIAAGLLWSVMRKESQFDPAVRSPVGAVGLLQLMPYTARAEATRAGIRDFDIGDLEQPEANLHLGVVHLRASMDSLSGGWAAALAAYNGGRILAGRWQGFPESATPEGFVERIPFRETRAYVKQVLADNAQYEALYAAP